MIPVQLQWKPYGAALRTTRPAPGQIVGHDHAAWWVDEVAPIGPVDWTEDEASLVSRVGGRAEPVSLMLVQLAPRRGEQLLLRFQPTADALHVYVDEHVPVCLECGDPAPCRDRTAKRLAEWEMRNAEPYTVPGMCPACREPVTGRQRRLEFDNVVVPGGPPVTFHARGQCRAQAASYEQHAAATAEQG